MPYGQANNKSCLIVSVTIFLFNKCLTKIVVDADNITKLIKIISLKKEITSEVMHDWQKEGGWQCSNKIRDASFNFLF